MAIAKGAHEIVAQKVLQHLRRSEVEFFQKEMEEAVERVAFLHETRGEEQD